VLVFRRSQILLLRKGTTWKIQPKKSGLLWCCGRFPSAPWAWLANKSDEFDQVNNRISAVCESFGGNFPTPAGVLAKNVANNECRNGLGGEVSNGSNP